MLCLDLINGSNTAKNTFYWAIISLLLIAHVSCKKDDGDQNIFPVGIWQGTFDEKPLTIEFKNNGFFILISEAEDAIGFGRYSVNLEQQPGHLDLEFIDPPYNPFITLIEKIDDNTFRTELHEHEKTRLNAFSEAAILMKRVQSHVIPRMKTVEQRDEELKQLQFREMIWFEGKDRNKLLDICEALFRYQFMHNASGVQQNAKAYFLSIYQTDPPEDLMIRFENNLPPVKPGSEFKVDSGLKFRIDRIKWLDKNKVEIEGGYYEGNVSSSGNTYILQKKRGVWEVISDKMHWIS